MKWFFTSPIVVLITSVAVAASVAVIVLLSPRNGHRPSISKIKYIILHTTEGSKEGSLPKLRKFGEAHYMIDPQGNTYNLIEENRVARHAGRSMWDGQKGVDEFSLGIEMVGFHNTALTSAQENALAILLKNLKQKYNISDDQVLTHSMVAYGVPNRWHEFAHRGRKRCGMIMADPQLRARLGLHASPKNDPDVLNKRLMVADTYLFSILYGQSPNTLQAVQKVYTGPDANIISKERSAWFIARENYANAQTIYTFPDGRKFFGNQINNWSAVPLGTKVSFKNSDTPNETANTEQSSPVAKAEFKEIGIHGQNAFQIARGDYEKNTTIYFLPDGRIADGQQLNDNNRYLLTHLPVKTKILMGYVNGGQVTKNRSAFAITGRRWNSPATIYRLFGGEILTGDEVTASLIPRGTFIFFEQ